MAQSTDDTRSWRVGTHYQIHVYAYDPMSGEDIPIATALTVAAAAQIVRDHNKRDHNASLSADQVKVAVCEYLLGVNRGFVAESGHPLIAPTAIDWLGEGIVTAVLAVEAAS